MVYFTAKLIRNGDNYFGFVCLFLARQSPVEQGILIHKVSRPHTMMHQSVGLFWKSDQLIAETYYCFSGKFLQSLLTISSDQGKVRNQKFHSDKLITLSP
jgi:hypothetical protein